MKMKITRAQIEDAVGGKVVIMSENPILSSLNSFPDSIEIDVEEEHTDGICQACRPLHGSFKAQTCPAGQAVIYPASGLPSDFLEVPKPPKIEPLNTSKIRGEWREIDSNGYVSGGNDTEGSMSRIADKVNEIITRLNGYTN